jgi:DNA-binding MarR family transcriptional regulator
MTQDLFTHVGLDLLQLPALINRTVRRGVLLATAIDPDFQIDLTPQQLEILALLDKEGELRVVDIGKKLQISKAQMTQVIDKLSKRKFIDRNSCSVDRRVIHITLTSHGKNSLVANQSKLLNFMRDAMSQLSENELKELSKALQRVREIIELSHR